jgi:hypothetical protein
MARLARGRGRLLERFPVRAVAFLVVVLAAAFVVSQSCQKSQVRVTKDQAIERAEKQVDFNPTRTQVRLLRQGLNSTPFWMVSLSIPGDRQGTFDELAVVQINANTGKIKKVAVQRNEP